MPKSLLTKNQKQFVEKNKLVMSGAAMSRYFGFPRNSVGQWMRNNGVKVPASIKLKFRLEGIRGVALKPRPEDALIKKRYLTVNVNQLSILVKRSESFVKTSLKRQGLSIPKSIIRQRKIDSQIKPGNVPLNKGKKQTDYMSREAIERTKATQFKKGNLPHNAIGVEDGDIKVRHAHIERGNPPYKWIRLALGKWKQYHVYIWEQNNGQVPAGSIVVFKNGDTMDCAIENLKCITRAQHAENTRKTDQYIARSLSYVTGGKFKMDKGLYLEILNNKPLLDLKRKQIQLKQTINE